jgi:hypothetical protein
MTHAASARESTPAGASLVPTVARDLLLMRPARRSPRARHQTRTRVIGERSISDAVIVQRDHSIADPQPCCQRRVKHAITADRLAEKGGEHNTEGIDETVWLFQHPPLRDVERRMEDASRVKVEHGLEIDVKRGPIHRADVVNELPALRATAGSRHLENLEEIEIQRRRHERFPVDVLRLVSRQRQG